MILPVLSTTLVIVGRKHEKFRPEQDSNSHLVLYPLSYQAIWELAVTWILMEGSM